MSPGYNFEWGTMLGDIICYSILSGKEGDMSLIGSHGKVWIQKQRLLAQGILHKRNKTAGEKVQRKNIYFMQIIFDLTNKNEKCRKKIQQSHRINSQHCFWTLLFKDSLPYWYKLDIVMDHYSGKQ